MADQDMTRVAFYVDRDVKEEAARIAAGMGLDLSTYLRLSLHALVGEQGMPFKVAGLTSAPRRRD